MDLYRIWLSVVLGSCVAESTEIAKLELTPQQLYEERRSWHKYAGFNIKHMERALEIPLEKAKETWQIHNALGIESVFCTEENFPSCFRNIPHGPVVLFYKGDLSLLEKPNRVGIVGSRNPDRDGVKICDEICTDLTRSGVTIISGLAQGLDSVAHRAALGGNGKTVAFIGTPLDKAYPASHRALQQEICDKGCVISEYYAGQLTHGSAFLERNRLIAAASEAVCVIQAKDKSGSLTTAKRAEEYSKQLFAVPGNITNSLYDGTNHLIQDGAYLLMDAQDVLVYLGLAEKTTKAKRKPKPKLSEYEQKIYDCIGRETKSTGQIFSATRIPMVQLKALLTKMEMDGVITSSAPGVYSIK